jgi:peptidylprolyl isomerase
MTHRPRFAISAAALALTLALSGAACGSESDGADATTTTTDLVSCAEAYPAASGAPEGPDAIEARGEPDMVACEPSGSLEMIDEIVGTGAEVPAGATVTVQYSGVDAPTGTTFDSSWSRGETATFPLDQVIPGWTEGLVGMKEGGRRTLVIPAELAYGDSGPAPGQALVFTIDLVSVEGAAGATDTTAAAAG